MRAASTATTSNTSKPDNTQDIYDLSLRLSHRPMNGNASMEYMQYAPTEDSDRAGAGQVGQISKREIAEQYGLSSRDLRVFDQPMSGYPHILVREQTILIHLFDLRVLVQYDHARLFHVARVPDPDPDPDHHPKHASGHMDEDENKDDESPVSQIFSHNIGAKLRSGHRQVGSSRQPYELRVLEAALSSVTSVLEADYLLASKRVAQALRMTDSATLDEEGNLIHSRLQAMLDLKRRLVGVEQRALQVRNITQEILNEDEDMAAMYLTDKRTGRPHGVEDHQDVEYLFEAYFKSADGVVQEARGLMSQIRRTEETIQYILSVRRNQIMVLEARLEILMLALAGATLVAGWYGMNVVNYFEESQHAFAAVLVASFGFIAASSWFGMLKLRRLRRVRLQI